MSSLKLLSLILSAWRKIIIFSLCVRIRRTFSLGKLFPVLEHEIVFIDFLWSTWVTMQVILFIGEYFKRFINRELEQTKENIWKWCLIVFSGVEYFVVVFFKTAKWHFFVEYFSHKFPSLLDFFSYTQSLIFIKEAVIKYLFELYLLT